MTLKCKKIKGVEKSVCTCEQKIAYNYAFANHINYSDDYKKCATAISKNEVITQIRDLILQDIKRRDDMKKYNIDAIFTALNNGLQNYFDNFFIATNYEQIGKVFAIPYTII